MKSDTVNIGLVQSVSLADLREKATVTLLPRKYSSEYLEFVATCITDGIATALYIKDRLSQYSAVNIGCIQYSLVKSGASRSAPKQPEVALTNYNIPLDIKPAIKVLSKPPHEIYGMISSMHDSILFDAIRNLNASYVFDFDSMAWLRNVNPRLFVMENLVPEMPYGLSNDIIIKFLSIHVFTTVCALIKPFKDIANPTTRLMITNTSIDIKGEGKYTASILEEESSNKRLTISCKFDKSFINRTNGIVPSRRSYK
jgi:hypothetical protein